MIVKPQLAALWFASLNMILPSTVSAKNTRRVFIIDEEGIGIIPKQDLEKPSRTLKSLKSDKGSKSSKSYKQVGDNLIGEALGNQFGNSVCLSKDGKVFAVGGPAYNDVNDNYLGYVRVFKWSGKRNEWIQLGENFYGDAAGDKLGESLALSGDGSVVIMGAPGFDNDAGQVRIYKWEEGAWTKKGDTNTINGEAANDESGWSVTINHDGSIIGVSAKINRGHVRVFEFDDGLSSWVQKGMRIVGENAGDQSGHSISLDSSGTTIAIGAPGNESGHVRVYDWDESINSSWVMRGADIDGESAGDESGSSVSLNDAGTVVAIGAPYASNYAGEARVYDWSRGEWIKRGASIVGEDGEFGWSISLNSSGDTLAVGAPAGDAGAESVYIYKWDGLTKWNLKEKIQGDGGSFGSSVSISADALTVAAGAHNYDDNRGVARVYEWS